MSPQKTAMNKLFRLLNRWIALCGILVLSGCAGSNALKQGKKMELARDFDQALVYYDAAYKADPKNHEARLYFERARFQASMAHSDQGRKLKAMGKLEEALPEFQRAFAIDPANAMAEQDIRETLRLLEIRKKQLASDQKVLDEFSRKPSSSPRDLLAPVNNALITLKLTAQLKKNYQSIAKTAGINVIFDAAMTDEKLNKNISLDLFNVTLTDALDVLALQSKTYWSVINANTIIVAEDNAQTRATLEEQVIKTFYLNNSLSKEDLNEVVMMIQRVLQLTKFAQLNNQNAIVVKDTPDRVAMVEKILNSIDKAKPEVLIDVALVEVDRGFTRNIGVSPPTGTTITYNNGATGTNASTNTVPLNQLKNITGADFSLTIPATTLSWQMSQANGKTLQNPSLRATDGKTVKLTVGTKYPIAQSGFSPYAGGTLGGTPYVQFQYIDIGVQMDMTPRVMLNRDIALNLKMTVNAKSGEVTQNTFTQPILTQRTVEQDIRLKEGESNIIGGIIQDTDTLSVEGVAGLQNIPIIKYLFSTRKTTKDNTEIIIAITPHVLRLPELVAEDLEPIAMLGNGLTPRLLKKSGGAAAGATEAPDKSTPSKTPPSGMPSPAPIAGTGTDIPAPTASAPAPRLAFLKLLPSQNDVIKGNKIAVPMAIENAQNLFAASCTISFDPKLLRLVDVQNGGFLSSDGKMVALAPRIENETGQAVISISRPPESAGSNGNGVLLNLLFEAISPGNAQISFAQGTLRDATQSTLPASFSSTQIVIK
jgi:general secretion pathway protein D